MRAQPFVSLTAGGAQVREVNVMSVTQIKMALVVPVQSNCCPLVRSTNDVHKIVFLVQKVCCWLYGVWLVCGLSWVTGPKFSLCDGLGRVEEIRPTDNSGPV